MTAVVDPIAVVCNPRARAERRDPGIRDRFAAVIGPRGVVLAPPDVAALDETCAGLHAAGARRVALHGGDGTGHRVITALMRAWGDDPLPEVMWLHGGTNNTASRSMGSYGSAEWQLRALVGELDGGPRLPRTRRWPLRVEGRHHGFLWGIGIVERFIRAYEAGGNPSIAGATWTLARAVGSAFTGGAFASAFFAPVTVDVEGDGQRWPDRGWRILTAGAVDQIGLGFRPFPGVLSNPGKLHAFASASTPVGFALDLPWLYLGLPARNPLAHDQICGRLTLRSEQPLAYNLDGDLYTALTNDLVVETTVPVTFVLPPGARSSMG